MKLRSFFKRDPVFYLCSLILSLWLAAALNAAEIKIDRPLKVGVWENRPLVYHHPIDGAAGLFPGIVGYVAEREGWQVDYVKGVFFDLMDRLKKGKIDILVSTAVTRDRKKELLFNREDIFTNWGVVLVAEDSETASLMDLNNKTVAAMKGAVYTDSAGGIRTLANQFGINAVFRDTKSYRDAMEAVARGDADAAVVNRIVAERQARDFGLKQSGVIFQPMEIRMAFPKAGQFSSLLIQQFDKHMAELRAKPDSFYHKALARAQGSNKKDLQTARYYKWLSYGLILAAGVGGLLLVWSLTLRKMVSQRTGELSRTNESLVEEISERERAEAEREQLNTALVEKNAELEQVVYVASHDLRSPLVNIDGYSRELAYSISDMKEMLDSGSHGKAAEALAPILDEEIPEALSFIRTSTAKMDTLLAGLLRLSRSGREALNIKRLDMDNLVDKVVASTEFRIKEAGVRVEAEPLPDCLADEIQVDQVFSNLLDNALKCLDPERPGKIRITGREEGQGCVYCVEDNGIGIDPNHFNKIFEIFHQLDPARNKGEGLGLTIVKRILTRLDGSIRVESEPGRGSRFYVILPMER
ncbi:MAG: ATP-binding protein [Desulfobacterales bacterium]|nr:ATP-binding protein [Desulfobacterales bacterium]